MTHFITILATGLGVGYSPVAPGTLGTLVAIPIYYFLSEIPFPLYEITLAGFFFLAVWISEKAETVFGKKDDQKIVIDEMMGLFITMLWIPKTPLFIMAGFILFRIFDIVKPFPIRQLEKRFKGGFGVVLDDVGAGIYSNIILQIISYSFTLSPSGRGLG
ncbi:MAG: phosphatidylglycerophosphatase A [Deltaproteobacteria bacterium]|nr:phosphatidylglycerophosphatase A [Deltaproteobacteria bacterium]